MNKAPYGIVNTAITPYGVTQMRLFYVIMNMIYFNIL